MLTGATGGIGRAVARRLADGGAQLALCGRRRRELEELAGTLGAEALVADLTDQDQVADVIARIDRLWASAPDVLINNAGAFSLAPVAETEIEDFDQHLAVNLRAPFQLIRSWLPAMLDRASGQILNIGSVAGRRAFPGNAAYSASKFGLRGLHEVLVEELRGSGLRVTWIEPSAVDTSLWDPLRPDERSDLPSRGEMLSASAVAEAVFFAVTQPGDVAIEEIAIRANRTVIS